MPKLSEVVMVLEVRVLELDERERVMPLPDMPEVVMVLEDRLFEFEEDNKYIPCPFDTLAATIVLLNIVELIVPDAYTPFVKLFIPAKFLIVTLSLPFVLIP